MAKVSAVGAAGFQGSIAKSFPAFGKARRGAAPALRVATPGGRVVAPHMSEKEQAPPSVFDHVDLREFLADVARQRRSQRPSWSLGVWARQLKLAQTASLTRIINGDRLPGEDLVGRLIEQLGLTAEASDYFRLMVRAARTQARDPALHQLALQRLRELAMARHRDMAKTQGPALHEVRSGRLMALWLAAPLDRLDTHLRAGGLEAMPLGGLGLVCLQIADYTDTSFGPYVELACSVSAKPIGAGVGDAGLFFQFVLTTSRRVATAGRAVWGNNHHWGSIDLRLDEGGVHCQASLHDGQPVIELTLPRDAELESPMTEVNDLWGFSVPGPMQCRFRMQFTAVGTRASADAARLVIPDASPLSGFWRDLEPTPLQALRFATVEGQFHAPEPFR